MCGFVGAIHQAGTQVKLKDIKKMNQTIIHRGPDDEGYFENEAVTAGFRRLSIIDLAHGAQPLSDQHQKYWIVFNGEIYNYRELRKTLMAEGYKFATDSDTEVIIAMYQKYGHATAEFLRGMFAFVIWNTETHEVYGARDHFGIKPMYYANHDENVYFASEKKAILRVLEDKTISESALQNYFTFQYVPEPTTLTPSIQKLPAGSYFVKTPGSQMEVIRYYQPTFRPVLHPVDESAVSQQVLDVLTDSVAKHMRADVPVGAFLSGGIDSSIVVALARQRHPDLQTFSVGFERPGYSEIDLAQDTAQQLKVSNQSQTITATEFMNEFPRFVYATDDPLADPAAVPHYFLARLAHQYCKVALTGEGADEVFGGYNIYKEPQALRVFEKMPTTLATWLKNLANHLPEGMKGKSFLQRGTTPLEQRFVGNAKIFSERQKRQLLTHYDGAFPYTRVTADLYQHNRGLDPVTRMEDIDMKTWLIGDLLVNADRTTMATSLELRTPFIDKEVFAMARQIPANLKVAHGTTKYILRRAAQELLPEPVLQRRKLGFPVPIRHWLKKELADWAETIMKETPVEDYVNRQYCLKLLHDHQAGKHDYSRQIWTVLTFMMWYQVYIEKRYRDMLGSEASS